MVHTLCQVCSAHPPARRTSDPAPTRDTDQPHSTANFLKRHVQALWWHASAWLTQPLLQHLLHLHLPLGKSDLTGAAHTAPFFTSAIPSTITVPFIPAAIPATGTRNTAVQQDALHGQAAAAAACSTQRCTAALGCSIDVCTCTCSARSELSMPVFGVAATPQQHSSNLSLSEMCVTQGSATVPLCRCLRALPPPGDSDNFSDDFFGNVNVPKIPLLVTEFVCESRLSFWLEAECRQLSLAVAEVLPTIAVAATVCATGAGATPTATLLSQAGSNSGHWWMLQLHPQNLLQLCRSTWQGPASACHCSTQKLTPAVKLLQQKLATEVGCFKLLHFLHLQTSKAAKGAPNGHMC